MVAKEPLIRETLSEGSLLLVVLLVIGEGFRSPFWTLLVLVRLGRFLILISSLLPLLTSV